MAVPIGVLIHAGGTSTPTPYFTPWSGRGGNSAVFVADVIALNLSSSGAGYKILITVQTKNSEDVDPGTDLGTFAEISTVPSSPPTKYLTGLKELFRYKIEVFGSAASDWVHMRMLGPSWLSN
jgi:hypothetical protein